MAAIETITSVVPKVALWRRVLTVVGSLMISASAVIGAYPFLSDMNEQRMAEEQFALSSSSTSYDPAEMVRELDAADEYNQLLAGESGVTPDDVVPYADQLKMQSGDVLCWLDIPKLDLKVPVYRGTSDEVLMKGAGHIETSSLPVGGPSTNTAITGHSGMPNSRMFDMLDWLDPGDEFIIWTLGMPLAYEVIWTDLVLPEESEVIEIEEGVDAATLITCRPIGVNSHRFIVHGERTDYDAAMEDTDISYLANPRTAAFAASLAALGAGVFVPLYLLLFRPRETWFLTSVAGENLMSSMQVSALSSELGEDMQLTFKSLGRFELDVFGDTAKGHWSYVDGDPSRVRINFETDVLGNASIDGGGGVGEVILPRGEYVLTVQDGQLVMDVDYGKSELVFDTSKPS